MKINFNHLIRQLLPPHKRQQVRLMLLGAFVRPLAQLFSSFDRWRDDIRMMVNVNSQVKVFEEYLRKKYNEPIAIKIVTFDDGLLMVCLEHEGITLQPEIGLENESVIEVPLDGEIRANFGDVDFIVYVPAGIDLNLIRAEIEKYKQALIRYKIIAPGR